MQDPIVARGVEKAYGRHPVLRGVDLDVPSGTLVAVVGVDQDEDAPGIQVAHRLKIPVVIGDSSNEETLRSAGVQRCQSVLAITDGDMVVVRKETDVVNGDIVAATFRSGKSDDDEATVKTFRKIDGRVWLFPQNPDYAPIPGDDARIIGKVVTVFSPKGGTGKTVVASSSAFSCRDRVPHSASSR